MVWNTDVGQIPRIAILQKVVVTKVNWLLWKKRIFKEKRSVYASGQESLATPIARWHEHLSVLVYQERSTTFATSISFGLRDSVDEFNRRGAVNRVTCRNPIIGVPDQHRPETAHWNSAGERPRYLPSPAHSVRPTAPDDMHGIEL